MIGDVPILIGIEDTAFTAALPAGLVSDADGDPLLVEVRGVGGAALPAWLAYDVRTRTLNGTPPANFNGNVVIEVAASDGSVETVRQVVIAINPVNDRPVLDHALADRTNAEDNAISFVLPADAFSDVDRDTLVLSARLANGEALPTWLSFAEGKFTGTPPANYNGVIDIEVTASDGLLSVADIFRLTIDPVNDAPTLLAALADASGAEDSFVDVTIPMGSFADVDGDILTLSARLAGGSALPSWLSFEAGRLTGTPPADYNGAIDIEVTASDGLLSASDVFRLTISATNDRPVVLAALADASFAEDHGIDIAVPADTFADIDGDDLTLSATLADGSPLPSWLTFAEGRITGMPPADLNGSFDILVTASDGELTVSDTLRLTIDAVNDGPTLQILLEDVNSPEETAIDVAIPVGTFADVDGDALTLSARLADGGALPAWLSFDGGRLTGTPPADYNGFVDVEITASDGSQTVSDVFRLAITPLNDPPVVFARLSDVNFAEDQAVDVLIPAGTFADIDGDALALTATLADGAALPAWLSFADGRLTGTPPANFNGAIDIKVTASDGVLSASDHFRLTVDPVNDAPTLERLLADLGSAEDMAIDIALPAGTFADLDGDTLVLTARLADGSALPTWLSFDGGRLTGTPPADYNGFVDIEVTASDGALTVADVFRLTVTPVNDAPALLAPLADALFDEDQAIDPALPAGAFADVDGDALTLSATLAGGAPLPSWLTFADGRFTGTPPANYNGVIDIAVTASDGALTAGDTFRLTIGAVNDRPTLEALLPDAHSAEDSAFDVAIPAGTFADVDGDALTVTATLANGDALPEWISFDGARFTGTPPADFNGAVDIQVTASDGALGVSDTFRLTIDPVNDRPTLKIVLPDLMRPEDAAIDITIPAGTFGDVDGDVLTLTARLSGGAALPVWLSFDNGRLTGTPPANFHGALDIEVLAGDGALAVSDTFRLTVSPQNDPPVLLTPLADAVFAEDKPVDFRIPAGTFADVDGDGLTLTATLVGGGPLPAWLSFAGDRFTGTPPANFNGSLDVVVTASDSAASVSDTLRLTILAVNDAPRVERVFANVSSPEDTAIDLAVPAGIFSDVDGDSLALTARLTNGNALPGWLSFDGARFTGTPPANFNGAVDIELFANDGLLAASTTFRLTIDPVNDAPVVAADIADAVKPGGYAFVLPVAAASFADADGDALTLSARLVGGAPLPEWLLFNGTSFSGTPPRSLSANYAIEVTASDGKATAAQVFALKITPSNAAPVIGAQIPVQTINEDTAVNFAIPAGAFVDPDADRLTLTATLGNGAPLPAWLAFDGTRLTGTPPANQNGTLSIRVSASDGEFAVAQVFDLVVAPVNDAPTPANDGLFLVRGGENLTILASALLENDRDIEGDPLAIVSVSNGAKGLVKIAANGDIVYTPDLGFAGNDSFQYTVSDGRLTSSATVIVQVSNPFAGWQQGTDGNDKLFGNMSALNEVFGGAGDDHIKGGKLADQLAGGDGADHIQGMQGDDTLYGMNGNDKLNGGDGFDTAVLAGDRASYVLTTLNGELRLTDMDPVANGNDGVDTLVGIERLQFRGGETLSIASPIVLDLNGDGSELLSAAASQAAFDMDGDGRPDDTAWFGAGDAILFLDRDGNGTVSSAKEFSFVQDAIDARSDLEGLRAFDSNADGKLSAGDAKFAEFRLWQDRNGDGVAEAAEIATLSAANVASIGLAGTPTTVTADAGSAIAINTGKFTRTDGSQATFSDAALTYYSAATGADEKTIETAQRSFAKKGKKYEITAKGGELFVTLRKANGAVDAAGRIAPSTLIKFSDKTIGMLAPVILDLDGDGIELVKRSKSTARFDMDGDGTRDDSGWIGKGDGFLVIDRDNDGLITSASELSLLAERPGARSDLDALAALDSNRDRKIDASDLRFGELKVWADANRDGITDAGELKTLAELEIASISLSAAATDQSVKAGDNILLATSSFTRTDGSVGSVGDAALAYKPNAGRSSSGLLGAADAILGMDGDLDRLTSALRSGLGGEGAAGSAAASLPPGFDAFDFGTPASPAAAAAKTAMSSKRSQDLPRTTMTGGAVPADPRVALLAQDMAAFGARSGEGTWRDRQAQGGGGYEYFASH